MKVDDPIHLSRGGGRPIRIAVLTAIPTPYRDPFWNVMAENPGIELEVIYCAKQKGDRPWDLAWEQNYTVHYPESINYARRWGPAASLYWNPQTRGILRAGQFDGIIVGGYNHPTMLWAIGYARRHKIPYFLASESYLQQKRSSWKHLIKSWLVRSIVKNARGCLPTGTLAAEYLIHYGAKEERLCHVPNVPDVVALFQTARELQPRREAIRDRLGLRGKTVLFIGRFIPMKGGDLLIRAFREMHHEFDAELVMLGDGPMRKAWESLAEAEGLAAFVRFAGFQAPEALPEWFAAADLMCLPSNNETWSVVVLEALSSGLPVVITDRVGVYANAVTDERVGKVVRANDLEALKSGMRAQLNESVDRETMFEAWSATRTEFSYAQVATKLCNTLLEWCQPQGRERHSK